jgi:hypothetical protein
MYRVFIESLNQLYPHTAPNECIPHTINNEIITQYLAKLILIIDVASVEGHVARFVEKGIPGFVGEI